MFYKIIIFSSFLFGFSSFLLGDSLSVNVSLQGQGLIIGTPENINLGTISTGNTIETGFLDYFWIEDLRGTNTGHYTTIQCDGLYGPSNVVITGIQLSGASVEMIAGKSNDTLIYSNLNTWTDITEPQLYLYRNDSVLNNGTINRYGNKPAIKIEVPANAPVGNYKGKITYTLYDMPFSYF